jgi:hypothetical protein
LRGLNLNHERTEEMKMTKTAACKQALAETSDLFRFGGQWKFSRFDASVKAWRESIAADYWNATNHRRRHLIERAREILNPDMEDGYQYEPGDVTGGKWQSYV